MRLDATLLRRFVELAGDRLTGDWVVIGGCVLPLLGIVHRATADIDVAGPDEADMGQMRILMEIAEDLGLPVHTVNQAGAFFLREVDGWQDHLVEIHRGDQATLHVPDATLFLLLKLRRLSEADLEDCRAMIEHADARREPVDRRRVRTHVQAQLESEGPADRIRRLQELLDLVGAS